LTETLKNPQTQPAYNSVLEDRKEISLPHPDIDLETADQEVRGFLLAMGAILTCLEINGFLLE